MIMSFVHWFNLLATPIVMLWPSLVDSPSNSLWLIEAAFFIDFFRKCIVKKPKSMAMDSYDIFVEYLRSNMILDLIPLIPSIFSGMNLKFTFLKVVRVYEIKMLYYAFNWLMRTFSTKKSKSEQDDIEYAFSTCSKILSLLHYLACLWIYIGSEEFLEYETGYLPW